ncbi:MAG: hypothetical protein WD795_06945 [Woeseia sp.]
MSGASVCDDPDATPYISLGFVDHGRSPIERELGEYEQLTQEVHILARGSPNLSFGFSHRYTKFNFDGIEPQTNAHLHTSSFPVHWRTGEDKNFRVSVAPALSGSSNVMGHPQRYRSDTVQVELALVWQRRLSDRLSASYGLCGDHRFGDYKVYPMAGLDWRPHPDWTFDIGFPSSSVTYEITKSLATGIRFAPDGSEWHVMGRDFVGESRLVYEAYALEWVLDVHVAAKLRVTASLGRQLRNRFEMTLLRGERLDVESESVNRAGLELRWMFL